jgi:hypothetical protein
MDGRNKSGHDAAFPFNDLSLCAFGSFKRIMYTMHVRIALL